MSEMKVVVIKLGIDFDLQAEIEARAKKPVELTNSGADELGKVVAVKASSKKKDDDKRSAAEARAKAKADAEAADSERVDGAVKALIVNSAQSKASSASDLLAAAGRLPDGEFKSLMTKIKRILKERGLEVQKSTRKGVVYFTAVRF